MCDQLKKLTAIRFWFMIGTRTQCEKSLIDDINKFTYATNDMFKRDTYGTCKNFNKRGPNPKHNQQWNKKIVQRKHANSSKQLQHKTNYKHEHKTKWNAKWKIENLKHVAKNSHLNNLSTKTLVHLHCCKFQPSLTSILQ